MIPMKRPPQNPISRARSGFTLSETLIAATVVSTAMIAVIGLLSTGLNLGRESTNTTSATILARRIAEDVAVQPVSAAAPLGTGTQNVQLFDTSLQPLSTTGASAQSAYQDGSPDLAAAYVATWELLPRTDLGDNMSALIVTVESPAALAQDKRKTFRYATLLRQ